MRFWIEKERRLQTNVFDDIIKKEREYVMNKREVFYDEIMNIKNKHYQEVALKLVDALPDYFFHEAAASTGKYHPKYAQGDGGLLRHTKAAVRFAVELLGDPLIGDKYTAREKDLMLIALIMHDGFKRGVKEEKYTRIDHPLISANYIMEHKDNLGLVEEDALFLKNVISSHMGIWNKDYDGNEVLPVPKTKWENFVHMCDYLASRKCIQFSFDQNNNIIEE